MNPIEVRKRLLIAESEVNRVQMIHRWKAMVQGLDGLVSRAQSADTRTGSMMSLLAHGAAAMGHFTQRGPKSSWMHKAVCGVRLGAALWLLFRSRRGEGGESGGRKEALAPAGRPVRDESNKWMG